MEHRHQKFLLHNIILVQRKGIESVTCCLRTENQAANSEPMPFASAKYLGTPKLGWTRPGENNQLTLHTRCWCLLFLIPLSSHKKWWFDPQCLFLRRKAETGWWKERGTSHLDIVEVAVVRHGKLKLSKLDKDLGPRVCRDNPRAVDRLAVLGCVRYVLLRHIRVACEESLLGSKLKRPGDPPK